MECSHSTSSKRVSGSMALETDTIAKECYDFASTIEHSKLVIANEPLTICGSDSSEDECTIVSESCSKPDQLVQNFDIPDIVFDGNNFQFSGKQGSSNSKANLSLTDHNVKDGLAVLEILCSHNVVDCPEFVDIANVTGVLEAQNLIEDTEVLELSDDDDDVVFVKEYKEVKKASPERIVDYPADDNELLKIRRNPVRNARNKSRDLSKDLLYEEDFAILDVSDNELEKKENKPPEKKSTASSQLPKEWPVNVHERPEYNSATNTIEPLDYTIRDIQRKTAAKKIKIDASVVQKKGKKKAIKRRRKPRAVPEVEKVPLETLKPLVNSTTDMLKDFFIKSKQHKDLTNFTSDICTFENKVAILRNQALLFSVVNNLDQNEVVEKFKQLNVEIEAKD
nr:uncharacterized protein LOC111509284 [Leptinotarsa decemlineata]